MRARAVSTMRARAGTIRAPVMRTRGRILGLAICTGLPVGWLAHRDGCYTGLAKHRKVFRVFLGFAVITGCLYEGSA